MSFFKRANIVFLSVIFTATILVFPAITHAGDFEDALRAATTKEAADDALALTHIRGTRWVNIEDSNGNLIPPDAANPPKLYLQTDDGEVPFTPATKTKINYVGVYWFFTCDWNSNVLFEYSESMTDYITIYWGTPSDILDLHTIWGAWYFNSAKPFGRWAVEYQDDPVANEIFDDQGVVEGAVQGTLNEAMQNLLELINDILVSAINFLVNIIDELLVVNINLDAVTQGWAAVRDAANLLLVVGLLLIAGFNAARYQLEAYTAKALIPRLVLAAIFINFSFLLTNIFVEFGNVLTQYFMGDAVFTQIIPTGELQGLLAGTGLLAAGIAVYAFAGFVALSILIAFVILVAILLFRWVLLCILAIFSPLVFLFGVMPFTRGLTGQWWNYLVRYAFMGAIIGLLLNVAAKINFI